MGINSISVWHHLTNLQMEVLMLADEERQRFDGGAWTSFAEIMGLAQAQLTTTFLFPLVQQGRYQFTVKVRYSLTFVIFPAEKIIGDDLMSLPMIFIHVFIPSLVFP